MRKLFFGLLVTSGICLTSYILLEREKSERKASLLPLIQLAGKGAKTIDRAVTKVIPISDLDEEKLGEILKKRYQHLRNSPESKYVNDVLGGLQKFTKKDFQYEAFVSKSLVMNAYALPGGVIIITEGLFRKLENEAQLASILSHEIGHIELGHCFDSARFQLLSRKIFDSRIGAIADFVNRIMIEHSFSKTQENESDDYGFNLVELSEYHIEEFYKVFEILEKISPESTRSSSIVRDYFLSHPPLKQRIKKFREMSYSKKSKEIKKYKGRKNLSLRKSYQSGFRPSDEWY